MQFGDVNADGKVTITDAESIVSKILGIPPANFVERAADVNRDANITINDAVGVVNIIMNSGGTSAPKMEEPDSEAAEGGDPE